MPNTAVIKNSDFTLVNEFARPDSKRRLTLGEAIAAAGTTAFNVYRNTVGQIVLDPVTTIPVAEAWLWKNPKALAAVRKGLNDSAKGDTVYLGSFAGDGK